MHKRTILEIEFEFENILLTPAAEGTKVWGPGWGTLLGQGCLHTVHVSLKVRSNEEVNAGHYHGKRLCHPEG